MLAAQLDRLYPREGVMAARPFKHKKAQRPEWLRVPRRDQLPDDPIQRFKFRQELVRRAENIAWNQLYAMENELGAVARACRGPKYRRSLLIRMLSHYEHEPLVSKQRRRVAAVARGLALEGPTSPAPAAGPRVLSGEAWLRRQLWRNNYDRRGRSGTRAGAPAVGRLSWLQAGASGLAPRDRRHIRRTHAAEYDH